MGSFANNLKYARNYVIPLVNFVKTWHRPAMAWGVSASMLAVYFIDWKVVCARIPFYKSKFSESA
ncbi:hypothetical protein KSF78_0005289 [Schistosoma japonicum]|uniref:Cytochrome b-c1 complex subunit 10 n=1 Tax=Schistosoma japonicum TaxID=6182 RepID=C1L9N2_SCHJA|nr:hypothetical protein KSF78_0005289 [Schistosoma japonicum]KAH8877668.1 hypothetical protein KSF78_0005289 [Schistosoma japonicum]KAH8877669.1 hypothetical protein KSF78_0005289 [Schistosoma japonicum]KAH8877670.1 hypothetical protein KSF78_0005289 [Schistosoma japonicum]KAH8877674.1 hypothetical protein KSF78_0005289 [Schistosoma japonicum]